jgi:hypothetical protein
METQLRLNRKLISAKKKGGVSRLAEPEPQ